MILDDHGLSLEAFDPALARVLGADPRQPGGLVVAETALLGRDQVQLRDWLYCLARSPGTSVFRRLVQPMRLTPERFIAALEQGIDSDAERRGLPPARLTAATVAPSVLAFLERAERLAREHAWPAVNDAVLTLALVECADPDLRRLLQTGVTEEGLRRFERQLRAEVIRDTGADLFLPDASLNPQAFDPSGRRFCARLAEDARSLNVARLTSRHLLYTLLSVDSGLLPMALAVQGLNVKRDVHAVLARELAQPGRKRNDAFELTRSSVFDSVTQILKESQRLAFERGVRLVSEFDVHRAFGLRQTQELSRLLAGNRALDLTAFRGYLDSAEPDADQEAAPIQRLSIADIETRIRERVIGQDAAVARILPWIKRLRFGMPRDGRPAGVFLFMGPTGTGKTQLAKELARHVFGDEDLMLFLEMGQFQTKESMTMFVGAPPGYVGYGDGKLTNGLRDKPECVILFDEIEKAHPEVFHTLLRFADEGVISDPAGPVRDGRKCILVLTTNAGQNHLRDLLAQDPGAADDPQHLAAELLRAATDQMRQRGLTVEFLGRVDERLCFLPFTFESCRRIVDLVLQGEIDRLRKHKGILLEVDDDARDVLARETFDRRFEEGARAAPRAVNEHILTPVIDLVTEAEAAHPELVPARFHASAPDSTAVTVKGMP